jgi:hypothetical protein
LATAELVESITPSRLSNRDSTKRGWGVSVAAKLSAKLSEIFSKIGRVVVGVVVGLV